MTGVGIVLLLATLAAFAWALWPRRPAGRRATSPPPPASRRAHSPDQAALPAAAPDTAPGPSKALVAAPAAGPTPDANSAPSPGAAPERTAAEGRPSPGRSGPPERAERPGRTTRPGRAGPSRRGPREDDRRDDRQDEPGTARTGTRGTGPSVEEPSGAERDAPTAPGPEAGESGAGTPRPDGPPHRTSATAADGTPRRASLFAYGTVSPRPADAATGSAHAGDYACVHAATTGFAPARERIIELAVVRCDARGEIRDRWATLVDPGRDDVGGAALHGITSGDLHGAPTFGDVASEFLSRCEECVVVAHNGRFLESFLAAELLRVGVLAPTLPALDLTATVPVAGPAPNVRLATLARATGLRRAVPSSALDDALLVAGVLPALLGRLADRLRYPVAATPSTADPGTGRHRRETPTLPRRPGTLGTSPNGWLADLLAAVPMSAAEGHDGRLAAYLDALTTILPTGRIVADEVRELTGAAVRAGYPAAQLHSVLERLLESMRQTAFAQGGVSQEQVRHLRAAAHSLGVPQYFDDLVQAPPAPAPAPGSGTFSRPVRKPPPPAPPTLAARCGHCLQTGHYTAACPRLRRRGRGPAGGAGGVGPVGPVQPI